MKSIFRSGIALLFILCSVPAVFAEKTVLITDQYWNAVLEKETEGSLFVKIRMLAAEILPFVNAPVPLRIGGTRIKRIVLPAEPAESLTQRIISALETSEAGNIICSPLFLPYADDAATEFPDRQFFLTGDDPDFISSSENAVYFKTDYKTAYSEAGAWAAGLNEQVYALFFTGNSRYRTASKAFQDGWKAAGTGKKLNTKEFKRLEDANPDFLSAYESLLLKEPAAAAVFAGPVSGKVMDSFDGTPTRIITERASLWPDTGYDIAASVECGPVMIISVIVKSISTESYMKGGVIEAAFFSREQD